MRRLTILIGLVALALLGTPLLAAGDVNVFLGQKAFSEDLLDDFDLDKAFEYGAGVALDFEWPVMLTLDVLMASDDESFTYYDRGIGIYEYELEVETTEIHLGARYAFLKEGKIQPYVGAGVAYVQADFSCEGECFASFRGGPSNIDFVDDSDVGFFADAGVLFRFAEHFNVGVDVRWSDASAELEPSILRGSPPGDVDTGGLHYGVTFGYHW